MANNRTQEGSLTQNRDASAEMEAIKADIRRLREDLVDLGSTLLDATESRAHHAKSQLQDEIRERVELLRERLAQARERGYRSVADIEKRIEGRPFLYLCGAFVAGLLFAKLSDRR